MLRYLYSLALPGGRRVVVVYYPPKPETEPNRPYVAGRPETKDEGLAQLGLTSGMSSHRGLPPIIPAKKRGR